RRVAVAAAATSRLSRPARRMKVVGTMAVEDTVMMWEPSEPKLVRMSGPLGFAPRKPSGKFAWKMLSATRLACEESAAVMLWAAARAAASTAFARVARTRYPRPRSTARAVQRRTGPGHT